MLRLFFSISALLLISHGALTQMSHSGISVYVDPNNVSGGGFQSDVTISDDGQTVYSSADVSGVFKSTDGGLFFETINEGLKSPKVATLAITPDNPQILYAGTGDKGGSGGLFRSVDGGDSWELTGDGDNAQFAGNHSADSDLVPDGHPRSNGDLIVVDHGSNASSFTDDIIIAGTYKKGVSIFSQGGNVEMSSIDSGFVRSIAGNAFVQNKVYAAIQFATSSQNGIYEIDYTNLASPSSALVYQTPLPEGLTVLDNGHVYAAIGEAGIVKYDGMNWTVLDPDPNTNIDSNLQWTAVTGYVMLGNDVVYAGVSNLNTGSSYSNIWRTTNSGTSWSSLVDATSSANNNVSDKIYGKSYDWWYRLQGFQNGGLGRKRAVVSSIEVAIGLDASTEADDIIYVSGRGGIWKSANGGVLWEPAVYNMQVTANNGVAVNPNNPTQVAIANTDYVVLETSNRFENNAISKDKPSGAESKGFDVIFDTEADQLILGAGSRDNNVGGEVYVKSSSSLGVQGTSWTSTDLGLVPEAGNGRVRAICYGYHNGTSHTPNRIILAAVEGKGVFRYQNGNWSPSTGISIGATKRSNFVWPDNGNSGLVYLIDLSAGIFRSIDGGENWTNIWTDMTLRNNDFFNTGFIAAADDDPTTLYVSLQGETGSPINRSFKVYRIKNAHTSSPDITDISYHSVNVKIDRPGPIVIGADGRLWLTQQQNSSSSIYAGLYVMENPTTDLAFTDVTTPEYRNIAIQPSGIDVSSDGHIYISQNGTGLVKLLYSDTANIGLSPSCISIYPHSNSSLYTLSGSLHNFIIEITDGSGVLFETLIHNGRSVSFDINDLPTGIFFIRVFDSNNNQLCFQERIK